MNQHFVPILIAAMAVSSLAFAEGKSGQSTAPMSRQEATEACQKKGKTGSELQACIEKKMQGDSAEKPRDGTGGSGLTGSGTY